MTAAALRRALEAYGTAPVVSLERRASAYRTSLALEDVDVAFADGTRAELVLKQFGRSALTEAATRVRPEFLYDPAREVLVYREILPRADLAAPRPYATMLDERRGSFWILLERVDGHPLWQEGDVAVWEEAGRALARFHEELAPEAERWAAEARLLRYDAAFFERWPPRAARFRRLPPVVARLAGSYADVAERLAALPSTVLHGELYPSNVLVRLRPAPCRICPVDWELAALGPGLVDLAALTSGWTDDVRERLVRAYREELTPQRRLADPDFAEALDLCRLHLALQWLGWAPGWSPPPEHAHDWAAEAAAAVARLGL